MCCLRPPTAAIESFKHVEKISRRGIAAPIWQPQRWRKKNFVGQKKNAAD